MPPALVPEMPAISNRPSANRASSTPHVKAPCDPPPCSANEIRLRFMPLLRAVAPRADSRHFGATGLFRFECRRAIPAIRWQRQPIAGAARAVKRVQPQRRIGGGKGDEFR